MTIYMLNGGSVVEMYKKYEEKIAVAVNAAGEAHCALLVRQLTGAPETKKWKKGALVKDVDLTPGTAIATFESSAAGDVYTGKSGTCHAAIFVKKVADGIEVWDQWASGHIGQRKLDGYRHGIRKLVWRKSEKGSPGYRQSNDGEAMYVITT